MTDRAQPHHGVPPRPLTQRFPHPGRRVEQAYRELDIALYGSDEEKKALGSPRALARPWDPATCIDPDLRDEVWSWLDDVVTWLNHEYVWDVAAMIPACWPKHPHLVHEIAVLADLRRRAGHALTGDALEEWHRTPCQHSPTDEATDEGALRAGTASRSRRRAAHPPPAASQDQSAAFTGRGHLTAHIEPSSALLGAPRCLVASLQVDIERARLR